MPDTPVLPKPQDILGDGKKKSLPSPDEVFNKPDTSVYADVLNKEESKSNFDSIVQNIPDITDDRKDLLKDLVINKGLRGQDLTNTILTLQGKHPRQSQDGSIKYYLNDKGLPVPLKNDERPPLGHEVASIWGTQKEANDDAWYTDLAKTVYNILPSSVENVVDLAQTAYEGVTDKESTWLNALKNSANYLKMAKDEDLNKSLFNTSGIDEWSDLLDKKRLDFSPEAIWGTVNGLLGSVGEFAVGGSGAGKVIKGIKGVEDLSKVQAITANVIGSTLTNLGEVRDAATEVGLTGRDRALFTSAVAPIISAIDVKWGLGTKMFGNTAAKEEKMAFLKALGKGIPRNAEGKITKEGIDEFAKVTTAGYTQVAKKLTQLTATDVLAEGGQEASQQFIQNASEQLWDKLTDKEKKKFATDAFSPESFGEYITNGLAGLVGGVPTVFAYNKAKGLAKQEDQNNSAFEIAKGGETVIKAFTGNLKMAVDNGTMTKEEADNALLKVTAYKQYYDQTKGTKLNDEQKKTVFGLTFEKASLESQIPTQYEEDKLNGLEQAKINNLKKQAKDIQGELDNIFLADELLRKETPTAKKTIEEIDKHLTPEEKKEGKPKLAGTLKELYDKHAEEATTENKSKVVETRGYEEIPFADWNQKRDSDKFKVLSEHLDTQNTSQVGELKLMKGANGEITNDTVHIKLPNNKWVILASSATDTKTKLRGHLHIENLPDNFDGHSVVIKPTRLTSGRIVLPVYNAETGKHVGYVREDNTGKANEKLFTKRAEKIGADKAAEMQDKEIEELQHLKTVKLTQNEIEAIKSNPNGEAKQVAQTVTPENKTQETQPIKEEIVKKNNGKQSTEGITPTQEELATRNDKEVSEQGTKPSKAKALRTGTKRAKQKIVDPIRLKALEIETDKPYDLVQQYFIKNGYIKFGEIFNLLNKSKTESNKRFSLQKNDAPTITELAHELEQGYSDLGFGESKYDSMDFYNAIEEVLNNFHSRTEMAKDLVSRWKVATEKEEHYLSDELSKTEAEDEGAVNAIVGEAENLGNDEITDLADDQTKFDIWGNPIIDIFKREEGDEGDQFQKAKVEKGSLDAEHHAKVFEITKQIQNAFPKITVLYDKTLTVAGKLSADGKTISINPFYAGLDTPIHEGGHVLIDAIGYNNSIIQKAIEQLKGTELYKQTKERYPELNEEMLNKEVLAEAIGREGEGIFDKEVQKNVFMKYLDYIFNRLKQLLGVDRNIAKSLAQQIIGGIGTKNLEGTNTGEEQFAKFIPFEEKSQAQQIRDLTLNFEQYSRDVLEKDPLGDAKDLQQINDLLAHPDISEQQAEILTKVKDDLLAKKKEDLKSWFQYREDMKEAIEIDNDIRELKAEAQAGKINEQEFVDGLIHLYNVVNSFQEAARKSVEANLMGKMAYLLFRQGKETLKKNEKFIEEISNKADISVKDIWLKNLGHMTEKVPELQVFGKLFDEAAFDKVEEAKEKKHTFEKLGTAVIKEVNKKEGLVGKALSAFSSDSAKYFDYLDNGKGELLTLDEAKEKNLSDAQIAFLKYNRELIAEHKGYILDDEVYNMPLQVLKTNPTFIETFKQEGITQAFSNYLGTNYNLKQVRIEFTNPLTNTKEVTDFGDVEKKLIEYGKNGVKEKAKALLLLVKYNIKAKKQLKKGVNADEKENPLLVKNNSQFSLNNNGVLSSQFDKPRDKNRGYSKDFYRAGISFIDDMTHVKHFSKLVLLINSIEYLNKNGYDEHLQKPNVVKWIEGWRDMHLFKNSKQTLPELDIALKFIRFVTSASTMMFNAPAALINVSMGIYNNWRAENSAKVAIGHARLFGEVGKHKVKKDYAYGAINPYAVDILRKYNVVSTDYDSNPKLFVGRLFDNLAHGMTRYGEFQIQGSMFLGLLSKEEYNSFEYKKNKQGIDELIVKDSVDEKELKKKLIAHKNRVSDIQGKYSDDDKRNISNNELGKAVLQFRLWSLDWWKERFGSEYITRDGQTKKGSWNEFVGDGLKDLRADVKEQGVKAIWNNKNAMSNLKGAMFVALFLVLKYQADDDERKRKGALSLNDALGNLLFVFDPDQLKFMVKRPIAAMGTVEKFINVFSDVIHFEDMSKTAKDIKKVLPANKLIDVAENITGN